MWGPDPLFCSSGGIILLSAHSCQTGGGLVAVPSLRSDRGATAAREPVRTRPVLSTCPGCAAQALLTAALCQEIARLPGEVIQLRTQLSQTSVNSHKPPSSDPPSRARVKVRELSTRPRGGQRGHRGTTRALLPVAEVDELHACQPTYCAGCGSPLTGRDPAPLRHQVTELPPLQPAVTEYQLHALRCRICGVIEPLYLRECQSVPLGRASKPS